MPAPTDPVPDRSRRHRGITGAVPAGLALITLGVLLLLDQLDVVDGAALFADFWPLVILLPGLWWLATGAPVWGTILAVVGALFLLDRLELTEVSFAALIGPSVAVIAGVAIIRAGVGLRRSARAATGQLDTARPSTRQPADDRVRGSSAVAVFGEARLTVTDDGTGSAAIPVAVTSVFGEVRVGVPAGWRVRDRTSVVLGESKVPDDQPSYPEAPVVELHGLVLFGEANVRYLDDDGTWP